MPPPGGRWVGVMEQKTTSPKPSAPLQRFRRGSTGRRDSIPVVPNLLAAGHVPAGWLESGRAMRATGLLGGVARCAARSLTPFSSKRLCNKCTTLPSGAHRPSGLCPIVQVASLVVILPRRLLPGERHGGNTRRLPAVIPSGHRAPLDSAEATFDSAKSL